MRRVLLIVLLLGATSVHAQQLNSILPLIIQFESSGNPTAQSNVPGSHATGLFQDQPATWAEALSLCGGACGSVSQYPTAASAPASIQIAANAALINDHGLSDWTCPNCDQQLVAAINQAGGIGAFQISGLSTNPADYASADTAAGLQTFDTNMTVATDGQPTTGTGTATVTGGSSISTEPFQFVYSTLIDGVTQQISTALQAVNTLVNPYLVLAISLATAFMGGRLLAGRGSWDTFASFVIRATIVGTLLAPDNQHFLQWIQQPIQNLPTMIGSAFGVPDAGPAAIFDDSAHALNAIANAIAANIPVSLRAIGNVLFVDVLAVLGVLALAILFAPFLLTVFLLLLMVVIGPVPILFGLFPLLSGWAKGYADVIATLALLLLAVDVVISIVEGGIIQVLSGFNICGSSQVDMSAFGELIVVLGGMALALKYAAPMVARIAGGVSIPLDAAGAWVARRATG